ncbi:MAG: ABC transporter permease, partial [Lachnospiraceae bacterium]|nr:ABC transporter permease [Lachnospiraceae bacterium]
MKKVGAWFKKQNAYFLVGLVMTGLAVMLGILSFFWTPFSTTAMSAAERFHGPSLRHLFGTDNFGRDIFSRVIQGIGTTVIVSSLIVVISAGAGILIGAITGYFGGILDEIIMRITDAIN